MPPPPLEWAGFGNVLLRGKTPPTYREGRLKSLLKETWKQCAGRRNAGRHFCETRYSKYARRLRNRAHAALRRAMASRARQMTRLLSKTGDACSKSAAGMRDDVRGRCEPRDGTSTLGLVHIKRAIASKLPRHRRSPARRRGDTNGWPLLCS